MKRLTTPLILLILLFTQLQAVGQDMTDDFIARTEFETTCINLGKIDRTEEGKSFYFKAVNTGNAPLVLTYVHASCNCVKLKYPRHPIAPGDTLKISGILNPRGISDGTFKRDVFVKSNSDTPQTRLFIIGEILSTAEAD